MTFQELKIQITAMVAADKLEGALSLLAGYFQGQDVARDVALLSGRLKALDSGLSRGLLGFNEHHQARNHLRAAILRLTEEEGDPLPGPGITSQYRASLARAAVLLILLTESGVTIKQAHQRSQVKNRKYIARALHELAENNMVEQFKEEKKTYWKLSEKGRKLALEFEASLGPLLG